MSDKKIILENDPELLKNATTRCTLPDGTEKILYRLNSPLVGHYVYIERNSDEDEKHARRNLCTHVTCTTCGKAVEKTSYCHDCGAKRQKERIGAYKATAKTILTELPGEGVWCEELDKFFWPGDEIEVEILELGDKDEFNYKDYSFFGLKKSVHTISLTEIIGEDSEDEFELDDEGVALQNKLDEYLENNALFIPDYSVWVNLTGVVRVKDVWPD